MTLFPPRTGLYPDPSYPSATPTPPSGWSQPQPSGSGITPPLGAPTPPAQSQGRWLAAVAASFSILALAVVLVSFALTVRPILSASGAVVGLVCAIVGIVCGHVAWSRTRGSGWRVVVVVALIAGYLAVALGLLHLVGLFVRDLPLRRRRAI